MKPLTCNHSQILAELRFSKPRFEIITHYSCYELKEIHILIYLESFLTRLQESSFSFTLYVSKRYIGAGFSVLCTQWSHIDIVCLSSDRDSTVSSKPCSIERDWAKLYRASFESLISYVYCKNFWVCKNSFKGVETTHKNPRNIIFSVGGSPKPNIFRMTTIPCKSSIFMVESWNLQKLQFYWIGHGLSFR